MALRQIAPEELARHSSIASRLWIVVDGLVYDVTEFHHPGGNDRLNDLGGQDATRQFAAIGHSSSAHLQMERMLVGQLSTSEGAAHTLPLGSDTLAAGKLLGSGDSEAPSVPDVVNAAVSSVAPISKHKTIVHGRPLKVAVTSLPSSPLRVWLPHRRLARRPPTCQRKPPAVAAQAGSIHRTSRPDEHLWSTRCRGFLPVRDPLAQLPPPFAILVELVELMPSALRCGTFRGLVEAEVRRTVHCHCVELSSRE